MSKTGEILFDMRLEDNGSLYCLRICSIMRQKVTFASINITERLSLYYISDTIIVMKELDCYNETIDVSELHFGTNIRGGILMVISAS